MKYLLPLLLILCTGTAQAEPNIDGLAKAWIQAIKDQSERQLKPLIHPGCKDKNIRYSVLERMVRGELPPRYSYHTIPMIGTREQLAEVFVVIPEKQLTLDYDVLTPEDKKKYTLGKTFPIALYQGRWYFAICTVKP